MQAKEEGMNTYATSNFIVWRHKVVQGDFTFDWLVIS